jgi:hypothetical protein
MAKVAQAVQQYLVARELRTALRTRRNVVSYGKRHLTIAHVRGEGLAHLRASHCELSSEKTISLNLFRPRCTRTFAAVSETFNWRAISPIDSP